MPVALVEERGEGEEGVDCSFFSNGQSAKKKKENFSFSSSFSFSFFFSFL